MFPVTAKGNIIDWFLQGPIITLSDMSYSTTKTLQDGM